MTCRRCSQCKGYSHHWLPNGRFGDDETVHSASLVQASHICKHCPQLGSQCSLCDGFGLISEDEVQGFCELECPDCDGEGVVEFTGPN